MLRIAPLIHFFVLLWIAVFAAPVGSMSALPMDVIRTIREEPNLQGEGSSSNLEALVVQSLKSIRQQRFDDALDLIDRALDINPSFRLAQMIKGDLLLARARPLESLGNVSDAPPDAVEDLRREAFVRLARYEAPPPVNLVPDALLELSPQQKYAVLVDTGRSRVYLFENRDGNPRYISDYYVTIGKLGTEKQKEGDKRTPLGVYHVTRSLDPDTLPDLYGDGAYPINYPNALDRKFGRTGYGIWLHGSPSDTYSRPPQASDGCVVLTNPDIVDLGKRIQVGFTPVVIAPKVNWVKMSEREILRRELQEQIETWRQDWESRDMGRYLSHYAKQFWSDDGNFSQWREQKQRVNQGKSWVKVELSNLSILRYPAAQPMVEVSFDQNYQSNNLKQVTRKRQYWVKQDQDWKIVYEGAG